jgi:ribulose-5-phosphate 4-epimerase/fuculose-1-phosphate aldolase
MATILDTHTGWSTGEQHAREQLAALYRAFVQFGWTDLVDTHISARVPGAEDQYLINPYGLLFEEITASSLLKADFDGNVIEGGHPFNQAGHLIHTAVLKARPDVNFVLHSHTRAGCAVSAMKCGLLPLSQHANSILGTLAYHDYQDVTSAKDECDRLAHDLGEAYLMILHNHGLLACGRTAGEGFYYHYTLEMACKVQVDVLGSGADYMVPGDAALADLKTWGQPMPGKPTGQRHWDAILRRLERTDPDFKT